VDELFERIFVFVPVALILFIRFFYENGKRKREEARSAGKSPASAAPRADEAGRKAPSAGRPAASDPLRGFLSSLFGVIEEPGELRPSSAAVEPADRAPVRQSAASPSRETSYGRRPFRYEDGASIAPSPPAERPFDSNAIEGLVSAPLDRQSPDSKRPEAQRDPGREGLSRIAALSELKRAVVMAELLGAPKALREE
jgi:hypothetical protein